MEGASRMEYSVTFARHFSRLLWLLLNESGNVEQQKAALRAAAMVSKDGPLTLATQEWRLTVNGALLPEALTGVQDLTAQMIGHAVRELAVDRGAVPADLLGLARILAGEPVPGDGGAAVQRRLQALGAETVRVSVVGLGAVGTLAARRGTSPMPAGVGEVPNAATAGAPAAVGPTPAHGRGLDVRGAPGYPGEGSSSYLAFAAVPPPSGSAADLLEELDGARSVKAAMPLLNDLVTIAEDAAREGRHDVVADVFHGVVAREESLAHAELKRACTMTVRRLARPALLRSVAQMLPRRRKRVDDYVRVLARGGEDGAEALIEQLTAAQSLSDRRIYFDSLVKLSAGVPALIHMLGDARWYVVRNAADLLGEMQAERAQGSLAQLLKHDDERVRQAAAGALSKLTTPKAVGAMQQALRDRSPRVRIQAAAGMGLRKDPHAAAALLKALDGEDDQEVQLAIVGALGRIATADAVERLIKIADNSGGLFRKRPTALRVTAVQALGEAGTPAATSALRHLLRDKREEVSQAALRLLGRAETSGQ